MRAFKLTLAAILAGCAVFAGAQELEGQAARARDFAAKAYLRLNPQATYLPGRVLVRFAPGAHETDRAAARKNAQGLLMRRYKIVPGLELIDSPLGTEKAMEILRKNPHVLFVQPDYVRHISATPNDPNFANLWGMNQASDYDINAPEAWDVFTGEQEFVIADIDTGIDYNHPDLVDNIWTNPGEIPANGIDDDGNGFIDDVHGYDFINGDSDPYDDHSHGTHTGGTIGARGNNGIGVAGVNWNCRILAVKVFDNTGNGPDADIAAGMDYVRQMGIKISNNSWGGFGQQDGSDAPALYAACQAMDSAGHLMVFAAGNSSYNNDTPGTTFIPASYSFDNILAVMAMDIYGNRSGFSCYGATTVDLAAPGSYIQSTVPNSGYAYFNGTSMATPHVTGGASLLWAYHPGLTSQDIKTRIMANTKPLASMVGLCVTGGMLNLQPLIVNASPAGDAGLDQVVEATGPLTSITLQATASDPDSDPLSFLWKEGATTVGTTNPAVLSRGLGNYTFDLTVADQHLATATDSVNVTVQDTTAPAFGPMSDVNATATSTYGANVSFSRSATDLVDGSIPAVCNPPSGALFAPGSTTVSASATDLSNNTGYGSFKVNVTYAWSGFQSPANNQQFKRGQKITVKFKLTGASSGITNLGATGAWAPVVGGVAGSQTTIGTFAYAKGTYSLTWNTSGRSVGSYRIFASFGDGVVRSVDVSLR